MARESAWRYRHDVEGCERQCRDQGTGGTGRKVQKMLPEGVRVEPYLNRSDW